MSASNLKEKSDLIPVMPLSDRIKEAIEESGKSKADIARACSVTSGAVTQWIDGATKSLKAEKALALERATGFRASWLTSGRGPRKVADREDPYWPFSKIPIERYTALDDVDKGYVQRRLLQAIDECQTAVDLTITAEDTRLFEESNGRKKPLTHQTRKKS